MKIIKITMVFVSALMLVLMTNPLLNAQDTPAFPGSKNLIYGPDPIGIGKNTSTEYKFTITLDANFDDTLIVKDVVPAEFDITSLSVSEYGGSAIYKKAGKSEGKGNPYKLDSHIIIWDLQNAVNTTAQSLTVTIVTSNNPGHAKRNILFYEPTSCGPLYLNDGAVMIDPDTFEAVTKPSNSLFVATCLDEFDVEGCVDGDNDGWSIDCGDCDDGDASINPGAEEMCEDDIDNNCDGNIDEGCIAP